MMIKIIIFAICIVFCFVNGLYEGDYCTFQRTNNAGTCTPLSKCKVALDELRFRRRPPQTCGFAEGNVALVCCPGSGPPIKVTTTTTTTPKYDDYYEEVQECAYPPEAITVNENAYAFKSWKKCIELADAVFPCAQRSFNLGAKKNRVSICEHEAAELIIGGTPAKPNEFPHMAALGYVSAEENNTIVWDCGGTLISERWIVSAAHCLYNRRLDANVSKARLGENDLRIAGDPKNLFEIIERVKHPDYVGNLVYNDITLLKIDRPVVYSNRILPACLHVGNEIKDNKAIATGYGLTSLDVKSKSDELLKVTVNKFTKEECSVKNPRQRKSPNGVVDTQICYGSKDESKDTCQGDSGGPLQIYNKGVHCTYTIIGITSVGKLCGTPGVPAIYTRVSAYIPWIDSVVWPN